MNEQIYLFPEQGQTHFPTAFDLGWSKFILLKTLAEIEFSSQGANSLKKKKRQTNFTGKRICGKKTLSTSVFLWG